MPSADPISSTLADWTDWWLRVGCACGRSADLPVKLLARLYGGDAPMHHFAARLRCSTCGDRPATAMLVDHVQYLASGFVSGTAPTVIQLDPTPP
jgi:hypothetical protein